MKPKHYIPAIAAILAVFMSIFLASCRRLGSVVEIKMEKEQAIDVTAGEFVYDGINVVLVYENGDTRTVALNENMISEADKLNFYKMGTHDIQVTYSSKITTTMKINVVRHQFDDIYKLGGYTCVYDGKPHKVDINYELPEGTKIEFPYGNTFTNAGEYTVEAIISKAGYESKTLSTKLIIEKAFIDISEVKFSDETFEYDGEVKTIEAKNVPQGIKVEYELWNQDKTIRLNNAVNVGTYKVVAKFTSSDENYDQNSSKEATLTITKAKYDMSNIKLNDAEKEYDGQEYTARLADSSLLPDGVVVTFKYYNMKGQEVRSTIDAGEYKIVASFDAKNSNYEDIDSIEAKLKVNKKKIYISDKVTFNSNTVNFDREYHSLVVEGTLPNNVTVEYINNNQKVAGEYKVIAMFTDSNKNEELDINQLEAYLIINTIIEAPKIIDSNTGEMRDIQDEDLKLIVDPETGNKRIEIEGFMDDKYKIKTLSYTDQQGNIATVNNFADGVKYNYEMVFQFLDEDEDSSVSLSPISGIIKYDILFSDDYRLEDSTVVYDGKPHGVKINKELLPGTTVEYPNGEEFTEAGTYQIKWIISKETFRTKELVANLKIGQAEYDMSGVVLNDVTREYDGNEYKPSDKNSVTYNTAFDNLPKGVTVKDVTYQTKVAENWIDVDSQYTKDVGEYKVFITYEYDDINYKAINGMEFLLTVTPKIIDMSGYTLTNKTEEKTQTQIQELKNNNQKLTLSIDPANLPEHVSVTYDYKLNDTSVGSDGVNDFGTYQVIATFSVDDTTKYSVSVASLTATLVVKEGGQA